MKTSALLTRIVRPLRGGQVTIPAAMRKQLGITEDSLLQFTLIEGELRIRPVQVAEPRVGLAWLEELYLRFAPVREEASFQSEEEINRAIDDAVGAVRKHRA